MQIKLIDDKKEWNDFIQRQAGSFLQSHEWGAFQSSFGRQAQYLTVIDNNKIIAGTLLLKYNLPFGQIYYFSPYGPIIYHELLLDYIKKQAIKDKAIFWRVENAGITGGLKVKDVHPRQTLILDLKNKSEEDILKQMKQKTRYNIRLAEKKGVKIKVSQDMKDIDIFYGLIKQTATRQKISVFPKKYYQTMAQTLGQSGFLKIYLAEYQGKILAANLIVFFNDTVTYLHGGTTYEQHEVMAPHLLQWKSIQDALHNGYQYYDFFGIDDARWPGVTRFKMGFNGQVKNYSGTHELPLNKMWYNTYRIAKKLKI